MLDISVNLVNSKFSYSKVATTFIAYKTSETKPPSYLLAFILSLVDLLTIIPNVPKIRRKIGKYATQTAANVKPYLNAKMNPPTALKRAKSILEYYSPIARCIASKISPIYVGSYSILLFSKNPISYLSSADR